MAGDEQHIDAGAVVPVMREEGGDRDVDAREDDAEDEADDDEEEADAACCCIIA